jgi:hypothetical protein
MKRLALIVLNPGSDDNYCVGVDVDGEKYRKFLTSPLGGAWTSDEITTLSTPSELALQVELVKARGADYFFFVFAGHGCHSDDHNDTLIDLGKKLFPLRRIRNTASRETIILDCCRERVTGLSLESVMAKAAAMRSDLNALACRRAFDAHTLKCSETTVVMQACSVGQTAGDTSEGGRYSHALLESAKSWGQGKPISPQTIDIFSVAQVHAAAERKLLEQEVKQKPTIEKPRSPLTFPFAVAAQ